MIIPTAKLISAMTMIQSNLSASQPSSSAVDLADKAQKRLFVISVVFGVLAALVAALLAWLVWRASNRYQDTVKADADARIAEAQEKSANALKDAGTANATAQRLEGDNLKLRGQVATLETRASEAKKDVAGLQIAAANAKAAQQRVEIELARANETTEELRKQNLATEERLKAEGTARESVQHAVASRTLKGELRAESQSALKKHAGTSFSLAAFGEPESIRLALQIEALLNGSKWVGKYPPLQLIGNSNILDPRLTWNREGVFIEAVEMRDWNPFPMAEALRNELTKHGIESKLAPTPLNDETFRPTRSIRIIVGLKPTRFWR